MFFKKMRVGHGLRPLCIPTLIINLGLLPTLPRKVKGKWRAEPWSCMRAQVTSLLWLLDLSKREVLAQVAQRASSSVRPS